MFVQETNIKTLIMSENQVKAKGIKVTTDGTSEEITFESNFVNLKEMQEIVGGHIEFVYLPNNLILVVNEEGKLNNLPVNEIVTSFYFPMIRDVIVGNVLLIDSKYLS
jgi:hypothetical protein